VKKLIFGLSNVLIGVYLFYCFGLTNIFSYEFLLFGSYYIILGVRKLQSNDIIIGSGAKTSLIEGVFYKDWIKVKVDYEKCVLKDFGYSYEKEIESGRVAGLNILSGDEMSNVEMIKANQLLLEYPYLKTEPEEEIIFQIPLYDTDKGNFSMRFIAGDIFLYIDQTNYKNCVLEMGEKRVKGFRKKQS